MYLRFVDNYAGAKEAIRRNQTYPAFRQFMDECMRDKDFQRQGIADFLILPVQRVTRYVLLLQGTACRVQTQPYHSHVITQTHSRTHARTRPPILSLSISFMQI